MIRSSRPKPELTSLQWTVTCLGGLISALFGGFLCFAVAQNHRHALLGSGFLPLDSDFLYYKDLHGHSLTVVSLLSYPFSMATAIGMGVFGGLMLSFGSIRGEPKADYLLRSRCGWLPTLGILIFSLITLVRPPERAIIDLDQSRITGGLLVSGSALNTSAIESVSSYFAKKENIIGVFTKDGEQIDLIAVENAEDATSAAAKIQEFIMSSGTNFE